VKLAISQLVPHRPTQNRRTNSTASSAAADRHTSLSTSTPCRRRQSMRCRRAPKRNGVHGSCPPGRHPHRVASSRWAERHHPAPAVRAQLDHQRAPDPWRPEHVKQINDLRSRARQDRRLAVDGPASACLPDDGSATDQTTSSHAHALDHVLAGWPCSSRDHMAPESISWA